MKSTDSKIITMLEKKRDHAFKMSTSESQLLREQWNAVYNVTFDLLKEARGLCSEATAFEEFQTRVTAWATKCFGEEHVHDPIVRGMRLCEEAIEFAQAVKVPLVQVLLLVEHVYSKKAGDPSQELGGVATTAFCAASSLRLKFEEVAFKELERVEAKSVKHFKKRNAVKLKLGFKS